MLLKQIVIGSVLKPVDDVRHFHKLAVSLAKTNKYGFNIIGFDSKNTDPPKNVFFHPVFRFSRLSPSRLLAPLRFLRQMIKVKPQLVIVNSPELLIITVLYKILFGGRLVYDVQENYYLNIRFLSPLPGLLRAVAATGIRTAERLTAPWVDHFLLAEKSYTSLPFVGRRYTVIENRALPAADIKASQNAPTDGALTLLVSGTLSLTYGLKESLAFFKTMLNTCPLLRLHLCGRVSDSKSMAFLQDAVASTPQITLTGGRAGVAHKEIRRAILEADVGLVFYPRSPTIDACFPTKIWEYMSCRLPMIIQTNRSWTSYCLSKQAAIAVDAEDPAMFSFAKWSANAFYPPHIDYSDVYWSDEEPKLQQLIERLLSA